MVAYERDIDSFLTKSTQLLSVFSSARCVTKYRKLNETTAFVTVKTYDPASGAIVKYKTDKTVDLGRLLLGSTKLAALLTGHASGSSPIHDKQEDVEQAIDVPMKDHIEEGAPTQATGQLGNADLAVKSSTNSGGSNKKKKKKGKK